MRIGIFSDLHCNVAGLSQALELMGDVDELVCLGDSIWEYRFSNEIVRLLKERGAHTILGNHEEGFLGPQGVRARQPDWIDRSLLGWLAERPHRLELQLGAKKLLAVQSDGLFMECAGLDGPVSVVMTCGSSAYAMMNSFIRLGRKLYVMCNTAARAGVLKFVTPVS